MSKRSVILFGVMIVFGVSGIALFENGHRVLGWLCVMVEIVAMLMSFEEEE